ncbi:MAG: class I SAM-dependent methyltransferase [candidate division WOR-3 bacterium]
MSENRFDELAEKYDSWYDTKGRLAFAIELAALRPLLKNLPHPWLELGVGTGRFAQALGIKKGVDPSVRLLEFARKRGIEVIKARGENLPFGDSSFGTVFLLTTWEFLNEPEKVLKEIYRVLKPEGMLVNGYLDKSGKWGKSYIEKAKAGHPLFSLARFYNYDEVVRITEGCGFKVVRTVSTLFQGPEETKDLEEPREGFHKGASFVVLLARKSDTRG